VRREKGKTRHGLPFGAHILHREEGAGAKRGRQLF